MSAPTGCSLTGFAASCSFNTWSPPLLDADFAQSPGSVTITDVNGEIPSNSFSGLANSGGYTGTPQLHLDCVFGTGNELTLLSDSLSSNLNWVEEMSIAECNNMVFGSGSFSFLTGMTILNVISGNITSIAADAFSGMTSLTTLYLYAAFPSSGIPSGLLNGLTSLTNIDMSRTTLNSIPSGLFDDLKYLTTLTLSECGLTTLPSNSFMPLLSLSSLDISTNNFTCDCSLVWLAHFETYSALSSSGTCGSPSSLYGFGVKRALYSLTCTTTDSSDDNDDWYHYGLIAGVSLALLLAVIGLAAFCYQRNELKKAKKAFELGHKQKTTDPKLTNFRNTQQTTVSNNQAWTVAGEDLKRTASPKLRNGKVKPVVNVPQNRHNNRIDDAEW